MSTIFVQIGSFNDDELIKTVTDCINKSSGENEIFFGIHECYIENKTEFNLNNVQVEYSKAPKNLGVGMSRYLANKFYNGEDYYLQVDAHTRFRQNWDKIIIDDLESHLSVGNNCILTAYPPGYWYNEDGTEFLDLDASAGLIRLKRNAAQKKNFKENRLIDQEGIVQDGTFCSESISGGFIFGPGEISNVVQNPAIFYFGEEFLRAASFYTNGYNLVSPKINVVFHLYGNHAKRIPAWVIFPEESEKLEDFSKVAIKMILSENRVGPRELGSVRPPREFARFLNIRFIQGTVA